MHQIVVGGRNKYFVNGANKNQQDVANLFQSVQLNVNNPHFLIMQGKITKVLNMKPQEILAMIEEAAGTRMFEDHKDKAIKTMEKKEAKLKDISELLDEEISPKLDKLREGKRALLEFQKIDVELAQLERFTVAFDYNYASHVTDKAASAKDTLVERSTHLTQMNEYLKDEIEEVQVRLAQAVEAKQKNGGMSSEATQRNKEIANELAKETTLHNLKLESIQDECKAKSVLEEALAEIRAEIQETLKKQETLMQKSESTIQANTEKVASIRKLEELLQSLTTGLSSSEGKDTGYMDQLREMKQHISEYETEIQQMKLKTTHLKKELQEVAPKAQVAEKQNSALINDLKANQDVLKMLESDLASIVCDEQKEQDLIRARREEDEKLVNLDQQIQDVERSVSGLQFSYSDPTPGFDRSKVKGLVAELINIPDKHKEATTALEVCAGGKLYNVVVESEVIGSQLLQNGKLRRRVTIIPLNKITAFKVQAEKIATAKKLAPGKVDLALHLVGSDEQVSVVMDYVFGSTLVCKDPATAKRVTFDNQVRMRSVTYEGDVYDPSGQLSGGSKTSASNVLNKMQKLKVLKHERRSVQKRIDEISAQLTDFVRVKEIFVGVQRNLELKKHEGVMLNERLASNPSTKIIQHFHALDSELKEIQCKLVKAQEEKKQAETKCKAIEKDMKEFSNNRESKLKDIKDEIAAGKKDIAKMQPLVAQMQQELDICREKLASFGREEKQLMSQVEASAKTIETLTEQAQQLKSDVRAVQKRLDASTSELEHERSALAKYDERIEAFETEKREKTQQIEDGKLELKSIETDLAKASTDYSNAKQVMQRLEKQFVWIQDQKQFFGQDGGEYDFEKRDVKDCKTRLVQLQKQHQVLNKSVDPQVIEKFDRVEKKEASLKQRLMTVKHDKSKISETIDNLDRLKREKLIETWTKVTGDFGLIFGDLLPGNTCKLEPIDGKDITEGLEVKVCLGGKWKQSLTELSGGQRSLIALSLILSLLQFKPAPMYILDEVDSALDLSHTQNIGQLLKTRFKGSQFIVVSLKDGMFNNANVLFRTKFVDGVSKVDRSQFKENGGAAKKTKTAHLNRRQSMLAEVL